MKLVLKTGKRVKDKMVYVIEVGLQWIFTVKSMKRQETDVHKFVDKCCQVEPYIVTSQGKPDFILYAVAVEYLVITEPSTFCDSIIDLVCTY